MATQQTFAIVGASLAGARAAETLRSEGFDGRVVLVGAESERPYERPPLSKDYLRGESPREKVDVHPETFYAENEIELRLSTPVAGLDPAGSAVTLEDGERVRYDRLLLTTGAEPRLLSVPGAELEGVLYLRDLEDSEAIAERVRRGGKVVVIGAGWIGAEVGASAREKGLEVMIVEQASVPLERVLGPEVGAVYADIHRDHGVELLAGAGLEAFEGERAVERVRLSDGRTIGCDFVVVGVGVAPRTELAEAAGLELENGVLVYPRVAGVHRELVRKAQGALRLAPGVRDPRAGQGGDRRLRRPLPPPPPLGARLQDPRGGPKDLGRCPGTTTKSGRLRCQRREGAGQLFVRASLEAAGW